MAAEFHFLTEPLRQRLDLILHLIEFSANPVLIVGDEGSGKSTLLRAIFRRAVSTWRTFIVESSAKTTLATLAHDLAESLSIRATGDEPMLEWNLVRDRVRAMSGSGAVVVGLLDNAETLPSEILRQLLALTVAEGSDSAFRLVLVARGRENDRWSLPLPEGFDAKKINRIAMPVFSPEQIEGYIESRFTAAGLTGASPLSGAAIDWIRLQSAGIPGRADSLVRRVLLSPETVPDAPWFDPDRLRALLGSVPVWSWAAVGGVAALTAIAGFWLSAPGIRAPDAVERMADPGAGMRSFQLALPKAETPAASEINNDAMTVPESINSAMPQPAPVAANEVADRTKTGMTAALIPPVTGSRPEVPDQNPSQDSSRKTGASSLRTAEPASTGASVRREAAWLLAQPETGYSIQLLAAFDRDALRQYLRQHGVDDQAFILEGKRNGRPWYIATFGYFSTRTAANAALAQLPEAMRQQRPWPRTIIELRAAAQP